MTNFAIDVGGLFKLYAIRLNCSLGVASNNDLLGLDPTFDQCIDIDYQELAPDVAEDLALDMDVALALQIPLHSKKLIDNGMNGWVNFVRYFADSGMRRRLICHPQCLQQKWVLLLSSYY